MILSDIRGHGYDVASYQGHDHDVVSYMGTWP